MRFHTRTSHRVAVIGAGPAGSVASFLLARGGMEVTLIEQHRFPRDKVCGECLSSLGIDVLTRLGLGRHLLTAGPVTLTRALLHASDGSRAEFTLPRPMWGISRLVLDQLLLDAARTAGASVVQPARCEAIEPRLRVRLLESNKLANFDADWIVLADGKGALIPSLSRPTGDLGLKAHFRGVAGPGDAIELFGVMGHYVGLAPIEGGLWNIALSIPTARVKTRAPDFDRLFSEIMQENKNLHARMRSAERGSEWMTSPLQRFGVTKSWPARMIPLGNAAAALEPIGGEGMGLAMRSAELAAESILAAAREGGQPDLHKLQLAYRRLWNVRRFACRAGARIISSRALSRLAIPIARGPAGPGALVLRLVGK